MLQKLRGGSKRRLSSSSWSFVFFNAANDGTNTTYMLWYSLSIDQDSGSFTECLAPNDNAIISGIPPPRKNSLHSRVYVQPYSCGDNPTPVAIVDEPYAMYLFGDAGTLFLLYYDTIDQSIHYSISAWGGSYRAHWLVANARYTFTGRIYFVLSPPGAEPTDAASDGSPWSPCGLAYGQLGIANSRCSYNASETPLDLSGWTGHLCSSWNGTHCFQNVTFGSDAVTSPHESLWIVTSPNSISYFKSSAGSAIGQDTIVPGHVDESPMLGMIVASCIFGSLVLWILIKAVQKKLWPTGTGTGTGASFPTAVVAASAPRRRNQEVTEFVNSLENYYSRERRRNHPGNTTGGRLGGDDGQEYNNNAQGRNHHRATQGGRGRGRGRGRRLPYNSGDDLIETMAQYPQYLPEYDDHDDNNHNYPHPQTHMYPGMTTSSSYDYDDDEEEDPDYGYGDPDYGYGVPTPFLIAPPLMRRGQEWSQAARGQERRRRFPRSPIGTPPPIMTPYTDSSMGDGDEEYGMGRDHYYRQGGGGEHMGRDIYYNKGRGGEHVGRDIFYHEGGSSLSSLSCSDLTFRPINDDDNEHFPPHVNLVDEGFTQEPLPPLIPSPRRVVSMPSMTMASPGPLSSTGLPYPLFIANQPPPGYSSTPGFPYPRIEEVEGVVRVVPAVDTNTTSRMEVVVGDDGNPCCVSTGRPAAADNNNIDDSTDFPIERQEHCL